MEVTSSASSHRPRRFPADLYIRIRTSFFPRRLHEAQTPLWRLLFPLLIGAFAVRAYVALSSDFILHPDEIMQYLEPAHALVFGNGMIYWEYYYGARSWLIPGMVATVLKAYQLLGLQNPAYYLGAVKLLLCFISLLIPYGMYTVGRHLLGEQSGRYALLLGVFWYELVGFAHKPMSEFIATAVFWGLLAAITRPPLPLSARRVSVIALVAVLFVALRFQYLPVGLAALLLAFFRAGKHGRFILPVIVVAGVVAVGVFDYVTWGGFWHSYVTNFKANVVLDQDRLGESSRLIFPLWFLIASGGISFVAFAFFLNYKRRGFFLLLLILIVLPHLIPNHYEYRFLFILIPLWLLIFADVLARGMRLFGKKRATSRWQRVVVGGGYIAIISLLGIFTALPYQQTVYKTSDVKNNFIDFLEYTAPSISTYRYLSTKKSLHSLIDATSYYVFSPGYYYLHQKVPFYDTSWLFHFDASQMNRYSSHIITGSPVIPVGIRRSLPLQKFFLETKKSGFISVPRLIYDKKLGKIVYWNEQGSPLPINGYTLVAHFGPYYVWERINNNVSVPQWKIYTPTGDDAWMREVMEVVFKEEIPPPPPTIEFMLK